MVLSNSQKSLLEKFNLTIDQLDYKYIENCYSIKQLERILKVLRSGEEGIYPHLTQFCENKLKDLDPSNPQLQLAKGILSYDDISEEERKNLKADLDDWSRQYSNQTYKNKPGNAASAIPPIRGQNNSAESMKSALVTEIRDSDKTKHKIRSPRSYKEWDKFDVEKELEKIDDEDKSKDVEESIKIDESVSVAGLSQAEREHIANLERIKGNEAFKAQDYEEAALYYTRSLSAFRTTKTLNNRAQTSLFRRGIAHKEAEMFDLAMVDFEILLKLEPENKSAKEQLKQIETLRFRTQAKKKVVIEEIESETLCDQENAEEEPNETKVEISKRLPIEEIAEHTRPLLDEICNCAGDADDIRPLSKNTQKMLNIFKDDNAPTTNPKIALVPDENKIIQNNKSKRNSNSISASNSCDLEKPSGTNFKQIQVKNNKDEDVNDNRIQSVVRPNENKSPLIVELETPHQSHEFPNNIIQNLEKYESIHSVPATNEKLHEKEMTDKLHTSTILKQKMTPYEFFHMWLSHNCNMNSNNGAACLLSVKPSELPQILTNKVDGPLLSGLLMAIKTIVNADLEELLTLIGSKLQVDLCEVRELLLV
ncbi:sperm-associated antigen 1 [Caerostris darwini]|uniref:Sperm-associated antigen 1 n=1 Tax=Caerostris darwini TaxID=1538125 RepID=A0AAV4PWF6_9ARAC|nr:sperm-associated antigen 1 [Caerostris darwini]